jgi:protein-S-isoprenylcysteine O-methyltransferase Ste14
MQDTTYRFLIGFLWLAWFAYWAVASGSVKPTQRRESVLSRTSHAVPLALGVLLIMWPRSANFLFQRFVPPGPLTDLAGLALLVAGLAFSVWARIHLGRNWSGTVTLKQDHELIRSGPYRFVRHPIYTGLLIAVLGTALSLGEWRGLITLALFAIAFVRKIGIEERFMRETFGDAYERYRRDVPALIPFIY